MPHDSKAWDITPTETERPRSGEAPCSDQELVKQAIALLDEHIKWQANRLLQDSMLMLFLFLSGVALGWAIAN